MANLKHSWGLCLCTAAAHEGGVPAPACTSSHGSQEAAAATEHACSFLHTVLFEPVQMASSLREAI